MPENLGLNNSMWSLISLFKSNSSGTLLLFPASILASWSKSKTSLFA